jgi:hypothetical protein
VSKILKARGRVVGVALAVLAGTVFGVVALLPILSLPPAQGRGLALIGLALLSLVAALCANAPLLAELNERTKADEARAEAQRQRARLNQMLQAPVLNALERSLRAEVNWRDAEGLKFYLFARIDGRFRIVASTVGESEHVRRLALRPEEGLVGIVALTHRATIVGKVSAQDHTRGIEALFDRGHNLVSPLPNPLDVGNVRKSDFDARWIAAVPVFLQTPPWSDEVIGVMTVDSTRSEETRFRELAFLSRLEKAAAAQAPYLLALANLETSERLPVPRGEPRYVVPVQSP